MGDDGYKEGLGDANISGAVDDYVENTTEIFSVSELDDLKRKERKLIQWRGNGYYRNKDKHKNA